MATNTEIITGNRTGVLPAFAPESYPKPTIRQGTGEMILAINSETPKPCKITDDLNRLLEGNLWSMGHSALMRQLLIESLNGAVALSEMTYPNLAHGKPLGVTISQLNGVFGLVQEEDRAVISNNVRPSLLSFLHRHKEQESLEKTNKGTKIATGRLAELPGKTKRIMLLNYLKNEDTNTPQAKTQLKNLVNTLANNNIISISPEGHILQLPLK